MKRLVGKDLQFDEKVLTISAQNLMASGLNYFQCYLCSAS